MHQPRLVGGERLAPGFGAPAFDELGFGDPGRVLPGLVGAGFFAPGFGARVVGARTGASPPARPRRSPRRSLRTCLACWRALVFSSSRVAGGGVSSGSNTSPSEAEVGKAASLASIFLGAGGMGTRIDGHVRVAGESGFAEMGGALLTSGDQRQEAAVALRHEAENGTSKQVWRAVAADRSTASLAARVEVARGAQKTDGEQSLRGLLLQRTATVNLKPELEIFADDVKCAHGATVGELDKRALFYLQSRGIDQARATALLTRAFVADAIDRIGDETVRAAFSANADVWLERAL